MRYTEWEPIYMEICKDLGIDPSSDDLPVRMLKATTMNSDLQDEDAIVPLMKGTVSVIGDGPNLTEDLDKHPLEGTVIASGSAVAKLMERGIRPDIVVTDLDGPICPQLKASMEGSVTLVHAHGDNTDLIMKYAAEFEGPVVLTTQGAPCNTVFNYGGFTDGDRCVCLAREFGAHRILLFGFDFDHPSIKEGSDPTRKLSKLRWAKRIIFTEGCSDIVWPLNC